MDQCVGDTLCIGGIMYGQRGIAAVLETAGQFVYVYAMSGNV